MNNAAKSIGSSLLGFATFAAFFAAIGLLCAFGTKIAFAIEPFINWLAGVLFVVDIIALLLAVFRKLRPFVGVVLFVSSFIFGISAWIYGLAVTLSLWGVLALVIGLFLGGVGVVPLGLLAAVFHGRWEIFFTLLITVVLTYGARMIGSSLAESDEEDDMPSGVIDIEADSVKERTWGDLE